MRPRRAICSKCDRIVLVFPSMRDGFHVFRLHSNNNGGVCRNGAAVPEDETEVA